MNANIDPVEAALEAVEKEEAAKVAEYVNAKLSELDGKVKALRALGVDVSITLEPPPARPFDKIEKVGSTKELGWYCYVDFLDGEGTRRRIDAARDAALYATRGGA